MTRLILGRDRPRSPSATPAAGPPGCTPPGSAPAPPGSAPPGSAPPGSAPPGSAPPGSAPPPFAPRLTLVGPPASGSAARERTATPEGAGDLVAALWAQYRNGRCRRARDRLVLHYQPLVRAVVHRTSGRLPGHVEPADLVQSGVFGLLAAIERYDPDRCPRFESYAVPRIRGAVLDELRAQDWVPRSVRLRAREAARAREQLTVRLRRTATEREVADELQVGPRELGAAATTQLLSIERLREGAPGGVVDTFADTAADPAAMAQEHEVRRQLWMAVAQLGERDRLVLRLYYLEGRTLAEIGRLLGVTESRICQLHARLVGRLRGALEELVAG